MLSLSKIGIHTIAALMSAWLNFFVIVSCTARAPLSLHRGHVGDSREINRIFSILSLNWFLSGSKEISKVIMAVSIKVVSTINFFQRIVLKGLLPFSISTTWRTSDKHHLPVGFFLVHWQFPNFFSVAILSIIKERPFSR